MKTIKLGVGIIIISVSIVIRLNGQTGPGGIGEKNGQTTLILWLDASQGVSTDASNNVISWNDLSGYANHALGNSADNEPDLQPNSINNLPTVKFDGYNDRLRIVGNASLQPENITILAVAKRTDVTGWGDIISRPYSTSWTAPYNSYTLNSCNAHNMGYNGRYPFSQVAVGEGVQVVNWNPPHGIIPDNQPYIHALGYNYHGNGMGSFLNNGLRGNDDIEIIPASGNLDYNSSILDVSIGTRSEYQLTPLGDHYLDGEIAEIIMFNCDLGEVEHIIVANYLATKYNIAIGWDQYAEVAGFTSNPIGLGREDQEAQQHLVSEGGSLRISCPSFPANTSYVFAAHNNGNLQGTPITEPTGYNNRLSRLWYMESKGTKPETITVTFNFPIKPSGDRNHYGLLYSANQDFSNPTQIMIANSVNVSEQTITFNVNSQNFANGFYTLGSKVNHWYGLNNDWTNTGNWDGSLPTATTDVVITGSCSHYPVLTLDATCRTLDIQSGGSINLGNSTLDVYKHFNFSGSVFNSDALGTLRFKGTTTSSVWAGSAVLRNVVSEKSGARLEILAPINISGNFSILSGTIDAVGTHWYLGGNLTIAESVSTITLGLEITCNGAGNQLISGNLTISTLNINNELSTVDITESNILPTNIFIQQGKLKTGNNTLENISISEYGLLELTETLNLKWTFTNNGGSLIHNNQKVVFVLNRNQTLTSDGLSFYDVEVNKTGGSLQLSDELNIAHDFTISSSGFIPNGKKILFNGTTDQLLTSSGTSLYDVEVSKGSGNLTMVDDLTVSNNLVVTSGSMNTGINNLTVNGTITNTVGVAGLRISSDANGSGSLINTSGNVSATVERYIEAAEWESGSDGWHFIAAPLTGQNMSGSWTPAGPGNGYDFFAWYETEGLWLNQKLPENEINTFAAGQGYLTAYQQTNTKTFAGVLNSGNIIKTLKNSGSGDYSGWNLLGNPYPSAIDWYLADKTLFEDDFAYIYNTHKGGGAGFEAVDGSMEDAFIPATQGFFVKAKESSHNQNFIFTNNTRTHGGTFYKDDQNANLLTLRLSDGGNYDETTLRIHPESLPIRDRFDALKLYSYNSIIPQIYSMTSDVFKVSVNTIPGITDTLIIPVSVRIPLTGTFTISISEIKGSFLNQPLFLVDKQTNMICNLTTQPTYSFISNVNDDPDRFLLKLSPVGIKEKNEDCPFQVLTQKKTITIFNPENRQGLVKVFNISGQEMAQLKLDGNSYFQIESGFSTGIYIISFVSSDIIIKKKIFIS